MYPATAYTNELYSFDDLPDEVEFWHNDGEGGALVGPIIVPKNGSAGQFFYGGETDLSPRISHFTDEWLVGVNQIDPGLGDCLILDKLTIEPAPAAGDGTRSIWVFDRFEDTYTVTHNTGSGTVSRTSVCVWEGEDNNGCPLYLEYRDEEPFAFQWVLNWTVFIDGIGCESGEAGPKESPQNSPVGTYTDPSASSTATVSE